MNDHEQDNFRIPEDLDRCDREQWWILKKRRTGILTKIIALLGKQIYSASLKNLSPRRLEELAIEAEERLLGGRGNRACSTAGEDKTATVSSRLL